MVEFKFDIANMSINNICGICGCASFVLAVGSFVSISAHAQTSTPAPGLPPSTVVVPPPQLPVVEPDKEIKGAALVEALRKGGFVLYMRHSETGLVTEKCEKSNLSAVGEENARNVGAALRELKIPIGAVRSSQPCRTGDTARLLDVGAVEITDDLNPTPAREGVDIGAVRSRRLAEMPPMGTNTVLVSHLHGSRKKEEWLHLGMGEIIVFRPDGKDGHEPVARITVTDWIALKKLMAADAVKR